MTDLSRINLSYFIHGEHPDGRRVDVADVEGDVVTLVNRSEAKRLIRDRDELLAKVARLERKLAEAEEKLDEADDREMTWAELMREREQPVGHQRISQKAHICEFCKWFDRYSEKSPDGLVP